MRFSPALLVLASLLLLPCVAAQSDPVGEPVGEPVLVGDAADVAAILAQSRALSAAYVAGDIGALVAVYAEDGVAAPGIETVACGRCLHFRRDEPGRGTARGAALATRR